MVGFDPIVRVLGGVLEAVGEELIDHSSERPGPVGHDLARPAVSTY
jgi:hypothetical protein